MPESGGQSALHRDVESSRHLPGDFRSLPLCLKPVGEDLRGLEEGTEVPQRHSPLRHRLHLRSRQDARVQDKRAMGLRGLIVRRRRDQPQVHYGLLLVPQRRTGLLEDKAVPGHRPLHSRRQVHRSLLDDFAVCEIMFLRQFLAALGFPQEDPTCLYEDNAAAIYLATEPGLRPRTKHIDVRFMYLVER
eukprot:842546-Rhodomonas_salina.1